MKVLIVIRTVPRQRFLVELYTKNLAREIKDLISKRKHPQAIAAIFSKGRLKREVLEHELPTLEADLILSEKSASWDLTG